MFEHHVQIQRKGIVFTVSNLETHDRMTLFQPQFLQSTSKIWKNQNSSFLQKMAHLLTFLIFLVNNKYGYSLNTDIWLLSIV